jgi:hypothetical protein
MPEDAATTSVPVTTSPTPKEETGFHAVYADFAKNLRIWFLAYGIGSTAIFVTNEAAARKLLDSGHALHVVYLLVAGVAVQVFVALLYKSIMWFLYIGEIYPDKKSSCVYQFADCVSTRYWPELICDLVTIGCFGGATWFLVIVFVR